MKYIGNPLIGDFLYGEKSNLIDRHALHSWRIEFMHPVFKKLMSFEVDLPEDMKNLI